jgi:hypothetical protein
MRKMAFLLALSLGVAGTVSATLSPTPAMAWGGRGGWGGGYRGGWGGGGWHGGGWGGYRGGWGRPGWGWGGFGVGMLAGAAIAAPYYGGYGYGYRYPAYPAYPAYGYPAYPAYRAYPVYPGYRYPYYRGW